MEADKFFIYIRNDITGQREVDYLDLETSKWLTALGMVAADYDGEWTNGTYIVMRDNAIKHLTEIMDLVYVVASTRSDPATGVTLTAFRKPAVRLEVDAVVKEDCVRIAKLGLHNFDPYYGVYDDGSCKFDPTRIYPMQTVVDQIANFKDLCQGDGTFITQHHDRYGSLQRITKFKVKCFMACDRMIDETFHLARTKLYKYKLSDETLLRLANLLDVTKLKYVYQDGQSQIWFDADRYVVKMVSYEDLYQHEIKMMKQLELTGMVPKIIDTWSIGDERLIVMEHRGQTVEQLYLRKVFCPAIIVNQIDHINMILNGMGLEHLDAHLGNWVVDKHGIVSLIDLEHLVPINGEGLSIEYKQHLKYFLGYDI